mgnify:CR=1 FL=1
MVLFGTDSISTSALGVFVFASAYHTIHTLPFGVVYGVTFGEYLKVRDSIMYRSWTFAK